MKKLIATTITLCASLLGIQANNSYKVEEISPPAGATLEVGDLKIKDDGTVYLCTRRGDVFSYKDGNWKQFAEGLQEPLGLVLGDKDGELYILQRPELTLVKDEDGDGVADLFKCVSDAWGFTANYHEYAMGLVQDKYGNFYGGLGLPFSKKQFNRFQGQWLGTIDVKDRGWYFKVTKDGQYERVAPGVREPVGSVINDKGDIFITDTQGSYVATNYIMHVEKNKFLGHPDGLLWDKSIKEKVDTLTKKKDNDRNKALDKMRKRPAVYIPYRKMGASIGGLQYDKTKGKFGPYSGQLFVTDVIQALIMRSTIEKVDGVYQGAVYNFYRKPNLGGGSHKMEFDKEGNMWVGQTARGWGHGHGLKKISFNGKMPFDLKEATLTQDGFDLHFTKELDLATAKNVANFQISSFQYQYTNVYTAKMINHKNHDVKINKLKNGNKTVSLSVSGLYPDTVVEIKYLNLKSKDGKSSDFTYTYYTLNKLRPNYISKSSL